jgi:hypothetical protein
LLFFAAKYAIAAQCRSLTSPPRRLILVPTFGTYIHLPKANLSIRSRGLSHIIEDSPVR